MMDETGIAAVVNSIASPGVYFGDIAFAVRLARECNEDAARMIADHPSRFGAFAILPLPDVGAAIREAEYALDTLKLEGICLLSHVGERHLGQPEENELYAELDRRKAVVFVHPLRNKSKNMPAYAYPSGSTELVLDTTRAIHNLLWNGTFGKYPNIRWIMPHGGGTIPFLVYRMSAMDDNPAGAGRLARRQRRERIAWAPLRRGGNLFSRATQMSDGDGGPLAPHVRQRLSVHASPYPAAGRQDPDCRLRGF